MKTVTRIGANVFNAKRIKDQPAETTELKLGVLLGVASFISRTTDPTTGAEIESLAGAFEFEDVSGDKVLSGKLFLSNEAYAKVNAPLTQALEAQKKTGVRAGVAFAANVYSVRIENGHGLRFDFTHEPAVTDPLAHLRADTTKHDEKKPAPKAGK